MNDEDDYDMPQDVVMQDDSGKAQISEYEREKLAAEKVKKAAAKKKRDEAKAQLEADIASGKVVPKKKAAKKTAKKKAKKKDNQEPSVKMSENLEKGLEFHSGVYKTHNMFIIFKDGARRMSFGLGKAQKLVECEAEIKAWVKKQEAKSGGMEDV